MDIYTYYTPALVVSLQNKLNDLSEKRERERKREGAKVLKPCRLLARIAATRFGNYCGLVLYPIYTFTI